MEKMLVHLFHSLPRQDCSLQDTGMVLGPAQAEGSGWSRFAGIGSLVLVFHLISPKFMVGVFKT